MPESFILAGVNLKPAKNMTNACLRQIKPIAKRPARMSRSTLGIAAFSANMLDTITQTNNIDIIPSSLSNNSRRRNPLLIKTCLTPQNK